MTLKFRLAAFALVFAWTGCSSSSDKDDTDAGSTSGSVLPTISPWTVSIWASGPTGDSAPDDIDYDGTHVWVDYQQKNGVKDCNGATYASQSALINASLDGGMVSTVVEYNLDGTIAASFRGVPGHVDGMVVDPSSHVVWVTGNEDGCATLSSINPADGGVVFYTGPSGGLLDAPHGGGYDDLAVVGGTMYVADSAPTATGTYPEISSITIAGTVASFTPVLSSNTTGFDYFSDAGEAVGLSDPDSMTVSPSGQLLLTSQGDSLLVLVTNPGAAGQFVQVIQTSDQLEDPTYVTGAKGQLLIVDATANVIYSMTNPSGFTAGQLFTEAPDDSSIIDWVGTLDLTTTTTIGPSSISTNGQIVTTGTITPLAIGFKKATGLIFLPSS